jgi:hypothetical protein
LTNSRPENSKNADGRRWGADGSRGDHLRKKRPIGVAFLNNADGEDGAVAKQQIAHPASIAARLKHHLHPLHHLHPFARSLSATIAYLFDLFDPPMLQACSIRLAAQA